MLPVPSALLPVGLFSVEAASLLHCDRKCCPVRRLPPTVLNERTSLLDKLSGLKHGSLLFTNCYIFHLKQIFAQKRIVLGLNGLSDINGAVSDWGQRSRPQSHRAWCSAQEGKGGKGVEMAMKYLAFLVWRRIFKK